MAAIRASGGLGEVFGLPIDDHPRNGARHIGAQLARIKRLRSAYLGRSTGKNRKGRLLAPPAEMFDHSETFGAQT
jgi:hypothetical protein